MFQLIRRSSYEEEFEIFISGILYSVIIITIIIIMMMMKKYIVMDMHHKMCHVIQDDV